MKQQLNSSSHQNNEAEIPTPLERLVIQPDDNPKLFQTIFKNRWARSKQLINTLKPLDEVMVKGCAYIRYMDDWVIFTKTRSASRRMVKKMHSVMQAIKFKLAKDKTFIGKIRSGFDFLGYRFSHQGLISLAAKTIQNFLQHVAALYEQKASAKSLLQYVKK